MTAATKWILAIVGMLAANIAAMVILAAIASATNPAIVPDYYERAAHYNETIDEAARSRDLGWSATLVLAREHVDVSVRDASGAAIDGASVRISGYARARAAQPIEVALVGAGRGAYRATLPAPAVGLHDLTVVVERGANRFTMPVTVDARVP